VNKSLRNTMRVWLQKQKKKDDTKSTSQVATPVEPSATPVEPLPQAESAEKSPGGAEAKPGVEETGDHEGATAGEQTGDGNAPAGSPPKEVWTLSSSFPPPYVS